MIYKQIEKVRAEGIGGPCCKRGLEWRIGADLIGLSSLVKIQPCFSQSDRNEGHQSQSRVTQFYWASIICQMQIILPLGRYYYILGDETGSFKNYMTVSESHGWQVAELEFKTAATAAAKSLQSCPTLCDPRDGNPPGSPVPGILQARTLEWVAISFSNACKWKVKVKSLSHVRLERSHGLQPTRLLRPWDFPGKSTGVGCHCLLREFKTRLAQF